MRIAWFTHSLVSCWNHGNAHFTRGVVRELMARGHTVTVAEPEAGWSLTNLLQDHGPSALLDYRQAYPELHSRRYSGEEEVEALVDGAEIVVVHEWSEPWVVAALGRMRRAGAPFTLLFHDTHHRAVSDPDAIRAFDLDGYDGVLAFGEALSQVYRRWGWGGRVFTWHEAADTRRFCPPVWEGTREGLVWIGNWGDGERSEELEEFLLRPAREAGLGLDIHGVRYPEPALAKLREHGARYRGWLSNAAAPEVFARHLATVHVPRRFYVQSLPGIPTIRVFEALACGIPLVCSPWEDAEGLFRPGHDYLVARSGAEMTRHLRAIASEPELRSCLVANGLNNIRTRNSCAHRAEELLGILAVLRGTSVAEMAA